MQGYKLMHIIFKVCKIESSRIPHSTVHEVNKEPPHSTATQMVKPEVLPYEIRAHLPIGYTAHSQ